MKYSQIRHWTPYVAFLLCILSISMAVLPVSSLGFELPKFVALALSALGGSIALAFSGRHYLPVVLGSMPGKLLLAFGALVMASLLWSVAPALSLLGTAPRFQGVLVMLCFLILAVVTALYGRTENGRKAFVYALLISNVIVVLYGIQQMLHIDPLADLWMSEAFLGRVFSTLGHPNILGQYILLTAPFLVVQWMRSTERVVQMVWGGMLIFNAALLLGTVSRSAMLGLLGMLVFTVPSLKRWIQNRVTRVTTSQAFVIVLIIVLCSSIGLVFFAQRFALTFESGRSASARGVIWSSTLHMIEDRPLGYGLETMGIVSPQYTGKELYKYESLTTTIDRAHNHVLHLLYALGPLGALLYCALVFFVLLYAWNARHHDTSGLIRAAAIAILGYQITLLFGFPSNATAAISWMLMGFIIGQVAEERRPMLWAEGALTALMLGISVVSTVVSVQWMQSRAIVAHARTERDPSVQLGLYQEAVLMFRYDRDVLIEAAEAHLFALEHVTEHREQLIASIDALITMLQSATSDHDGFAWLLSAWLAAAQGDVDTTTKALDEAKSFLPTSVTFHRTGMHLADLLHDGVLRETHRMGIRGLLPDGFFEDGSDMQRILLKQHPWLESL